MACAGGGCASLILEEYFLCIYSDRRSTEPCRAGTPAPLVKFFEISLDFQAGGRHTFLVNSRTTAYPPYTSQTIKIEIWKV